MAALRHQIPLDADSVAPNPTIAEVDGRSVPDGAAGGSPALELQRHLSDAVLRGWCAPHQVGTPTMTRQQLLTIVACAAGSWVAVFGAGWALLA